MCILKNRLHVLIISITAFHFSLTKHRFTERQVNGTVSMIQEMEAGFHPRNISLDSPLSQSPD